MIRHTAQLSIYDELARQDDEQAQREAAAATAARAADHTIAGYSARWQHSELLAGESCPGCGHTFTRGGHDGSRDHGIAEEVDGVAICEGMRLARRHLALALAADPHRRTPETADKAARAIAGGWSEQTVTAWQDNPQMLIDQEGAGRK